MQLTDMVSCSRFGLPMHARLLRLFATRIERGISCLQFQNLEYVACRASTRTSALMLKANKPTAHMSSVYVANLQQQRPALSRQSAPLACTGVCRRAYGALSFQICTSGGHASFGSHTSTSDITWCLIATPSRHIIPSHALDTTNAAHTKLPPTELLYCQM